MAYKATCIQFFERGKERTWEIGDIRIDRIKRRRYAVSIHLPHADRKLRVDDPVEANRSAVSHTLKGAHTIFDSFVSEAEAYGWVHKRDWMLIEGERICAPWGAHRCHDGTEYAVNAADFCDRCGIEVKGKRRHG